MDALRVYANRRMAAMLALGFASGLPFALSGQTLQAWMTEAGVSLGAIGLLNLVKVPYNFKFAWSPLVDRFVPPLMGRRRGWLMLTQAALACSLCALAWCGRGGTLYAIAAAAVVLAFLSATQDIVADAYRTDILTPEQRGAGAAVFIMGWRLAYLLSGGGALMLAARFSWSIVYVGMAGLMVLAVAVTALLPEPPVHGGAPKTLWDAVVNPLSDFLDRRGALVVLAFVLVFKLPESLLDSIKNTFLLQIGFRKEQVGAIAQSLGLVITIFGTFVGGAMVARLKLGRSLMISSLLLALSNLGFWLLAVRGPQHGLLVAAIASENFCFGLATAAFAAFLMSQCNQRFSATQFAVLSSLMAIPRDIGGAMTGFLVAAVGWKVFFLITIVAGLPGLLLLPWVMRAGGPEPVEVDPLGNRGFPVITGQAQGVAAGAGASAD